jgi:PAS domain S-box-containing protein
MDIDHHSQSSQEKGDSTLIRGIIRRLHRYRSGRRDLCSGEDRFRTIAEHVHIGIYRNTPGPEGRFVEVNQAQVRMLKYKNREDFLRLRVADLYMHPEDRVRFEAKIQKQGYVRGEEILLRKKDGSSLWASVTAVAVSGDQGEVLYYDGLIEDISQQKEIEQALKDSEDKYRTIFENTGTAMVILDADRTISLVNGEFEKLTGYSKKEVEGKRKWTEFIVPEDRQRMEKYAQMRKHSPDSAPRRYEFRFVNRKGEIRNGLVNVAIMPGSQQSIASLLDITEKRKMGEEIETRRKYLESVVRDAPDAIVTLDAMHHILEWNHGAEQVFGYRAAEVIGKNLDDLITNESNREEADSLTRRVLSGERTPPMETVRYRKDGSPVHVIVSGSPIRLGNELHGIVAIYTDISAHKKAEEEKAKIKAQLLQAQKMEAIGILAGGIAHDFNNLLTAIQGCAEMIMLNTHPDDPSYKDLEEICAATGRAADLTRQLLLFSRKHFMELKPLNLNKTVKSLLKMLQRLIGEDVEIETNFSTDLWTVKGDRSSLEQVIMNIVVNARDAMPGGGTLTIKTENISMSKVPLEHHSGDIPGQYVRLSISDTGTGMDRDTQEHCFEPFFSTKEFGKGTGLGLSVVYGIVKQHDGWINVYSEPDRGTIFKIYLPTAESLPKGECTEQVPLEQYQGKGERLLVVEDDQNVREFTMRALSNSGYEVFGVSSANETIELFEREKGRFDIIFSDVVLPDKTGIELVEELLTRNPGMKVLFSSGYSDHKSQWPKIQEKGYHFLEKPYALADLLRMVHELSA